MVRDLFFSREEIMEKKNLKEYVCQYWHDFYNDDDGCWVTEKTVSSKEEAEAWIHDFPGEEHTYYEIRTSTVSIMKDQLKRLEENRKSDLPKDVIIEAYKDVISKLEDDWRIMDCDKDGNWIYPEQNRPLLLLVRKESGKVFFKVQIYDSWTENLFNNYNVIAWKYLQVPSWLPSADFEKSYPKNIILDGNEPTCEIE